MPVFKTHSVIGLLLCIVIGAISLSLSTISPIDAVTTSIIIGVLIGNVSSIPKADTSRNPMV